MRGRSPVQSTIVDGCSPGVSPASSTTATTSPSISIASSALVAAGMPVVFAELTASGPVRWISSRVMSCRGIRTATVPRVSPRSHCSER